MTPRGFGSNLLLAVSQGNDVHLGRPNNALVYMEPLYGAWFMTACATVP